MSADANTLSEEFGFQEDSYMLTAGFPSRDFTKRAMQIVAKAAQAITQAPDGLSGECLQYGSRHGAAVYRKELAKFLTERYGDKESVHSEHLQITAGATQGLHFTASEFLLAGSVVFVEDPTYFIAINVLKEDLGMKVVPVVTDSEGLDLSELEKLIGEHIDPATPVSPWRPFRGMIYTIPTFNNPTSRSLPPARCRQLVEIARRHKLLVFCDDVYNLLAYTPDGSQPKRLLSYETKKYGKAEGNVISNGTFSKIMGPALRVGWIEASKSIIERLGKSNIAWSGGSFNHYGSQLVTYALKEGYQKELLEDMIKDHSARIKAVAKVLKEQLPGGIKYDIPQGGYFFWLELPERLDMDELAKVAEKDKVFFIIGKNCSPSGSFGNCIRISFSYYNEDKLVKGVSLLCKAINKVMKK